MTTFRFALCAAFTATTVWGQMFEQGFGSTLAGRGVLEIGRSGAQPLKPRIYGFFSGVWDPSLTALAAGTTGAIQSQSLFGITGTVGAYGRRDLKRSSFGWKYEGDYAHYTQQNQLDGTVHNVTLGYSNQIAKRLIFSMQAGGGTSNRVLGVSSATNQLVSERDALGIPTAELFDSRYNFATGVATLKYIKSNRVNMEFGGNAFVVDRKNKALAGVKALTALGRVSYRLDKKTWISAGYTFMHYDFPRAFGASDIHQTYALMERKIARKWDLTVEGGIYRVESLGLIQVRIDPLIAAIIGRNSGVEAFYRVAFIDSERVAIGRTYKRSSFLVEAARSIYPGNGILLTSRGSNLSARYSTSIDRWAIGANVNYSDYRSLTRTLPAYQGTNFGISANRALGHSLHLTSRADYRKFNLGQFDGALRRNGARLMIGIGFSPGDGPIAGH